jgi:type II secretory pathway pseudopilin PulG
MKGLMKRASFRLKDQRGISLLETVIALAILGVIGVAFMISISSSTRAVQILDEQTQAEALARSQLDAILEMTYNNDPGCYPSSCYPVTGNVPSQYSVSIEVQALDTPTCVQDGNCNTLQQVTVIISRPAGGGGNRSVLSVSAYKVKR